MRASETFESRLKVGDVIGYVNFRLQAACNRVFEPRSCGSCTMAAVS